MADEGDQIERTADRVRLPRGKVVHEVVLLSSVQSGRSYATRCGTVLYGSDGAMLTTRPVTCDVCSPAVFYGRKRVRG
jgi:hypothetical protein